MQLDLPKLVLQDVASGHTYETWTYHVAIAGRRHDRVIELDVSGGADLVRLIGCEDVVAHIGGAPAVPMIVTSAEAWSAEEDVTRGGMILVTENMASDDDVAAAIEEFRPDS